MELKAGYKQTEVGIFPSDWKIISLQEACRTPITYGIVQCGPHVDNGVPYIRVSDMNSHELDVSKMLRTSPKIAVSFKRSRVEEGDIVYALRGKIGEVRKIEPSVAGANLTQGTARIAPSKTIDGMFVLWTLRSNYVYDQAINQAKGSTFIEITLVNLRDIKLLTPPTKAEQTAIANVLSDTDALIQSLTRLIAKKRQIKQGAMQTLLNPYENGRLKAGWVVKKLGEVLRICHGKSQKEIKNKNGEYPILATGGEIGRTNKYLYDKPSVLIGRKGTIDMPQYMDSPFWTIDTLFYTEVFEPNNAKYLFYQFNLIDWYSHNEASGVPSLSARTIENIEIATPHQSQQTRIATILSDMDTEITALESKLSKYQQIKQGMMQNLLTGQIRLIPPETETNP